MVADGQNDVFEERFRLNISRVDYLNYYQGHVNWVIAESLDGKKIRFPAGWLSQYVNHSGVYGLFVLRYNQQGKLISLVRQSD